MLGESILSQTCLDVGISKVGFPVQQPPGVLVVVELIEYGCAESDFFRQHSQYVLVVLGIVGPVASREHFHTQVAIELLEKGGASELVHRVLAHLDVAEHYLQLLSELEPTLLLQFQDELLFRVL